MTRKALIIGAAAAAAVGGALAFAPGLLPGQTLHTGWKLTPAGRLTETGDLLTALTASPDGRWVAGVAAGQGIHRAYIFHPDGRLASEFEVGRAWSGIAWAPNSQRLYVSGGTQPIIHQLAVSASGEMSKMDGIKVPGFSMNGQDGPAPWLAGMAISPDGSQIWIAESASDQILRHSLATGEWSSLKLSQAAAPFALKLKGSRLYAALQGKSRLAEIDAQGMRVARMALVGRHPNAIEIGDGRIFVSCGNEDYVAILDEETLQMEERVSTRPYPDAPAGSTPSALALSSDGKALFAANSDNNSVAVIDIAERGRSEIEGYIPTGWYPVSLCASPDGKTLLIGNGKGLTTGTGPNGDHGGKFDPIAPKGYPYIVTQLKGGLQALAMPKAESLSRMTAQVLANSPLRPGMQRQPAKAPAPGSNPIPSRLGDPSPIKHVLYIIKENRTYDQLFGDFRDSQGRPKGNGDPGLVLFGENVSPNHHNLARTFSLFDNFYCLGEVSVDGHEWSKGGYVTDYHQRTWPQQYSGKGSPRVIPELAATPTGYLWEMAARQGVSYRTYYYHTTDNRNEDWHKARRAGRRDYDYVDIFIDEFKEYEKTGKMPQLMVMALSEDHTKGTRPGQPTPSAAVGSNDLGLGKIISAISQSSLWDKFAIFVVQDDAQNGPDHVDSHRSILMAASPWAKRGQVDSTHYTTASVLRTIELILGLRPMSQYDASATPMYAAFHNKPDTSPVPLQPARIDLEALNPPAPDLSAGIDFSEVDLLTLAQEHQLNRALWATQRPGEPYPGVVRRFGFSSEDDD
jgi:DNA-binding beta-propeller fold protein YncE